VRWIVVLSALCLLIPDIGRAAEPEPCLSCHRTSVSAPHAALGCQSCHVDGMAAAPGKVATAQTRARGCTECHPGTEGIFDHAMATRTAEKAFVDRAFSSRDPQFFSKNCASCHVSSCLDCHGPDAHALSRPSSETCHSCHQGYFVGADFFGRAPREDHTRYQRGSRYDGQAYLKMRPDIHEEAGMTCGACHSMQSLAEGRVAAKNCRDCHTPDPRVVEHRIPAHMETLECASCHASWAPQEYGSFYLRLGDSPNREYFSLKQDDKAEYVKSAYLKMQNAPPLGLNNDGRVSPIRPQFIAFYSDLRQLRATNPEENLLVAAEWKAFIPHTIRRGTPTCEGCHDAPRRFLLEDPRDRIYDLEKDGLPLPSFWSQQGQTLVNGRFMPPDRFTRMTTPTEEYTRAYIEKWRTLVKSVEPSSKP